MPQVVPLIGVAATSIGTYLAANSTAIAITLLTTAASYALNSFEANRAQSANASANQSIQQNIRQALGPRYRTYGYCRIGGQVLFEEVSGRSLYLSIALSDGIIDGIEKYYINDIECRIDDLGYVTTAPFNSSFGKLVRFEHKSGYANQTPSAILRSIFPGITEKHFGGGIAYATVEVYSPPNADAYAAIFNSTHPKFEFLQRGSLVYDPRDPAQDPALELSWKFSTNPALILMDYFTHQKGMGLSRSLFDRDTVILIANYCDELVAQKDGSLIKRYEMGGYYFLNEDPAVVIQDILNSFAGDIFLNQAGLFSITSDGLNGPTVQITKAMIRQMSADLTTGVLYQYSTIRSKYASDIHGYQFGIVEAEPWIDATALAQIGKDIPFDFNLRFVNRHSQARRLMKKKFYAINPKWTLKQELGFEGIQLFGERVASFKYDDLGIDYNFRIQSVGTDSTLGFAKIITNLESIAPESQTWNPLTEEGTAPPLVLDTAETISPQAPINLAALPNQATPVTALVSWDANTKNKTQEFLYRKTADAAWTAITVSPQQRYVALTNLVPGTSYIVAVRVISAAYGASDYAFLTFTASGSAGTTGALQIFSVQGGVGKIIATTKQAASAKAAYVAYSIVAVGASADWASAVFQNLVANQSTSNFEISTPLANADIYARSVGINGDSGPISGPLTVAITKTVSSTGVSGTISTGGQGNSNGNNGNNNGGASPSSPSSSGGPTNSGPTNDGGGGNNTSIY